MLQMNVPTSVGTYSTSCPWPELEILHGTDPPLGPLKIKQWDVIGQASHSCLKVC